MKVKEFHTDIGGKKLTARFTDLAQQANGSVLITYGNTIVLATAVMGKTAKEGGDFFPLSVEYEEKFYASGQILGSRFVRREGRPSDEAILSGRIVDRTIRPLFDQHIRHEVQVILTILSIEEDDPDVLAVLGASLALGTSDIPWNGPVSAVRIGKIKDTEHFVMNPTYSWRQNAEAEFELVACGKDGKINMIELGARESSESVVIEALHAASLEIDRLQTFQKDIISEIGKKKKNMPAIPTPLKVQKLFEEKIKSRLAESCFNGAGRENEYALKDEWRIIAESELSEDETKFADGYFDSAVNDLLHKEAIENSRRPDGRGFDDIRELFAQAGGISPMLHGSGIFYRGATHILSALTLGGPGDSQVIEGMEVEAKKRFMHHYNFPPFSTGETGRVGGTNRRMIGHGALAEKAIIPVLPPKEIFPYTIRIVSEALSSNGSTSMASVCASSLALMDAGVPISRPVAGIASGLLMKNEREYKVLTEIQGPEDHHGDMDFKVAGTSEGITAIQMDVKVDGIPIAILAEALEKARSARLKILDVVTAAIPTPRSDISPKAPKILTLKVKVEEIGKIIGPGGKTINTIKEKTLVEEIEIEDDGTIFITGKNGTAEKARDIIQDMTREYKPGEKFTGEVVKLAEFGAFVRIGHGVDGLVHISEIAPFRIDKVAKYVKEGDRVPVIIKEIDEKGRISLSIKKADPNYIKNIDGASNTELK